MSFLIQQTIIYAVPLMLVALAGIFAERSGIVNLALEGIMVFGAFVGVLFVNIMQTRETFTQSQGIPLMLLTMAVCAVFGSIFSLLLAFAAVNLNSNQTVSGTALNMLSPALVLFLINLITNQNVLTMASGDASGWFMIRKKALGFNVNTDYGFFLETFFFKTYPADWICILIFIVLSVWLYKTRYGLRLRACGENPHAADSLGINVKLMRYSGTLISGALAGIGGFVFSVTTANSSASGEVAGFGFLALAVMIFGNWKPLTVAGASLLFGIFKCIAAAYSTLDLNGDGRFLLAELNINTNFYRMLPYLITLVVLAFTSKKSRAPKAAGTPYDKSKR